MRIRHKGSGIIVFFGKGSKEKVNFGTDIWRTILYCYPLNLNTIATSCNKSSSSQARNRLFILHFFVWRGVWLQFVSVKIFLNCFQLSCSSKKFAKSSVQKVEVRKRQFPQFISSFLSFLQFYVRSVNDQRTGTPFVNLSGLADQNLDNDNSFSPLEKMLAEKGLKRYFPTLPKSL